MWFGRNGFGGGAEIGSGLGKSVTGVNDEATSGAFVADASGAAVVVVVVAVGVTDANVGDVLQISAVAALKSAGSEESLMAAMEVAAGFAAVEEGGDAFLGGPLLFPPPSSSSSSSKSS